MIFQSVEKFHTHDARAQLLDFDFVHVSIYFKRTENSFLEALTYFFYLI